MKECTMIAPCGMLCNECSVYKAAKDYQYALKLTMKWREAGIKEAKPEWFKCQGCHAHDTFAWGNDCKIRTCCVLEHELHHCDLCAQFPCDRILSFETDGMKHHRDAVGFLRKLQKQRNEKSHFEA